MPFPKILLKKRLWVGVVAAVLFMGVYVYVQFVKVRRRLYIYAPPSNLGEDVIGHDVMIIHSTCCRVTLSSFSSLSVLLFP